MSAGDAKKALNRPVSTGNLTTGVYPTGNAASSNDSLLVTLKHSN